MANILNLETAGEIKRKTVGIDGKPYGIVDVRELGIREQQRLFYCASYLMEYFSEEANLEKDEKAERLLKEGIDTILVDCPEEVKAKLTGPMKFQIIHAFKEANDAGVAK